MIFFYPSPFWLFRIERRHARAVEPSTPYVWALIKCSWALPLVPNSKYHKCSPSSTSVEDVSKGLWNVHQRQHSLDKKGGFETAPTGSARWKEDQQDREKKSDSPTFCVCKSTFPTGSVSQRGIYIWSHFIMDKSSLMFLSLKEQLERR